MERLTADVLVIGGGLAGGWAATAAALARALLRGPVYASLARSPHDLRAAMQHIQPAFGLAFKRLGIDPYSRRFQVSLHGEGTVRGIGGLRIVDDSCQTTVSGLYAAGEPNLARRLVLSGLDQIATRFEEVRA